MPYIMTVNVEDIMEWLPSLRTWSFLVSIVVRSHPGNLAKFYDKFRSKAEKQQAQLAYQCKATTENNNFFLAI